MLQLMKKTGLAKTWRSLQQLQPSLPQNIQSGFTIIESLMAIVVVAILMIALSPVIVLSVATRVQSKRVEMATQVARAYIDGVRNGAITPPPSIPTNTLLEDYAAPTSSGSLNCAANSYCSSMPDLYCFDSDGSGCSISSLTDMVVQAFRLNPASTNPDDGYRLGLRVYRADAFKDSSSLKKTKQSDGTTLARQATFTGGLGNRQAPLVEMTTDIVTSKTNYASFCSRLGGCQ
jgi:prepilin-type N-terminal cleavage/methylation domain-containing protein